MIEFHAGKGPDTQAIGIAFEEMFFDYALAPARAPLPVTVIGQARLPGANNILMALARKANRFLPQAEDAALWLGKEPPGIDALEAQLEGRDFVLGAYTVVDMMVYPPLAERTDLARWPNIARWVARMRLRPAVGRGMSILAR